jgi:hypothetical protein
MSILYPFFLGSKRGYECPLHALRQGVTLVKPVESLRIVLLEGIGQAMGEAFAGGCVDTLGSVPVRSSWPRDKHRHGSARGRQRSPVAATDVRSVPANRPRPGVRSATVPVSRYSAGASQAESRSGNPRRCPALRINSLVSLPVPGRTNLPWQGGRKIGSEERFPQLTRASPRTPGPPWPTSDFRRARCGRIRRASWLPPPRAAATTARGPVRLMVGHHLCCLNQLSRRSPLPPSPTSLPPRG